MTIETLKEFSPGKPGVVQRWREEIRIAEGWFRKWTDESERICQRYNAEGDHYGSEFNVLWSNTEVLRPALYSRPPKPDVRRRYRQKDPNAREAAQIIERGLKYQQDMQNPSYESTMQSFLTDYLLTGRGVLRVRYTPTIVRRQIPVTKQGNKYYTISANEVEEADVQEKNGDLFVQAEELQFEEAGLEWVHWRNFLHNPARDWRDVRWVAFYHLFSRDELRAAFGRSKEMRTELTYQADLTRGASENRPDLYKKAEAWEIWDLETRKVRFISPGLIEAPLAEFDDPYNLRGFFPTPEPLRSIHSNTSLLPVPEFRLYEDQANELDKTTNRIDLLTNALKVAGVYDASLPNLNDVVKSAENTLIPVKNWSHVTGKGGLDGAISWLPIEQIAKVLTVLYETREKVLDTIFQIVGISDILRGTTDPRETLGAQSLKSQFGGLRLSPRQRGLQKYLADCMNLQTELMAEKFDLTTLEIMTGIKVTPPIAFMLRNDALRNFSIDVETDSTLSLDESQRKQDVSEFFAMLGTFLQAANGSGLPFEAAKEMVLTGVREFKFGRNLEELLENMEPPQQPQPSLDEQAKMITAQARKTDAETKRLEAQANAKVAAEELLLQAEELGIKRSELRGKRLTEVLNMLADARRDRQSAAQAQLQVIEGGRA